MTERITVAEACDNAALWERVKTGEIELEFAYPDARPFSPLCYATAIHSIAEYTQDHYDIWFDQRHLPSARVDVKGDFILKIIPARESIRCFKIEASDGGLPPMICEDLPALQTGLAEYMGDGDGADWWPHEVQVVISVVSMSRRELVALGEWEG